MKQYEKATADFNKAIQIDSTSNNGYLFGDRGNLKEAIGDYSGAIQDYTTALKLCKTTEPSTPRENFYYYRGRTKLKSGDTASAIIDTDSAIYYWNSFPRAKYQRGRLEVIKGEYQKALDDYNVYQLTPDMADDKEFLEDIFYLGVLKFKTGDTTYCKYWAAAAKNNYKIAVEYMLRYCKIK
jgi:tetratricopeptide (TPR) repeat protein